MTKDRIPETIEDAALEIAGGLSLKRAAKFVDRSEGAVRAWSDPDKDGRPTLHQAVVLDSVYAKEKKGRTPFLAAYLHQLKKLNGDAPLNVDDILSEALDLPDVVGQLMGIIRKSKSINSEGGKTITSNEQREIRAMMRNLRRELDEVEAAVDQEMGSDNGT